MRRLGRLLSLALLGGGAEACVSDNHVACEEYQQAFEALPCAAGLESGVDCNAYADYPCPVPSFFRCLQQRQRCEEGVLVQDGVGACLEELACKD
jgi:hypothetical protein